MSYIEGFIAAVPTDKKDVYTAYSASVWDIFKDHGALGMVETWGDDVPDGEITSFPLAVKCADDETVVFSWVRWASKDARTAGWEAITADPRMSSDAITNMPFDGKRMIFGGFESILDVSA